MAYGAVANIVQGARVQNASRQARKPRRPEHTWNIVTRPYGIYPFCIAPVLAGETLDSAVMQVRVQSDPVHSRLMGWHKEYYWFYVKLRDLDDRDTLAAMLINPATSTTAIDTETAVTYHGFYATTGEPYLNFVEKCLKRVTEEYFRDAGETWNTNTVDTGIPQARVTPPGIWRSLTAAASVTFDDVQISTAGDDAFTLGELQAAYDEYEQLRQGAFVSMTFEDYLAQQGVRQPEQEEIHRPELIRYVRQWEYPVSAIDPTDGSAASAVQWSMSERIDKNRFFKEPGFILGVTVARPKMYLLGTAFNGVQLLSDYKKWLPSIMDDSPTASLVNIGDNKLGVNWADANGVWVDVKDLFLYGDQLVTNITNPEINTYSANTTADTIKYVSSTNINALFAAGSPDTTNARIREDGICTFNIRTRSMVATDTSRNVGTSQAVIL